jgi:hypothetical protein
MGEEHKTQKDKHTMKETDLLAAKIDLLMKWLDIVPLTRTP